VTFGKDHSRIRSVTAPKSLSLLKNATNTLSAVSVPNFAAALRENAVIAWLFRNPGFTTN
jgi:hypothetical protein